MYINKINSNIYNLPIKNNQRAVPNNVVSIIGFTSQKNPAPTNSYGEALIYMSQMDKLREETKEFPQDIEYRRNLLINAGLNPNNQHTIRSIIGTQELKNIMTEFNENEINYSTGKDFENVENHSIRANLHIHTISSDGFLSTQELLDKAVEYADSVAKNKPDTKKDPFVIAITDHDTLESTREAIKIISENPIKYKNLRVVLGAEITTFNNIGTNLVDKPTNTHVLVYGIDPNEKTFNSFINNTKAKKLNLELMAIDTANQTYNEYFGQNDFFNLEQAKILFNPLNKNITGIYNNLDMYFQNKIAVEHVLLKNHEIKKALEKHNMPTDTDGFITKLSEFKHITDRNNRVYNPEKTLPDFLSCCADIAPEKSIKIIQDGLKKKEISEFHDKLQQNISQYKITFHPKYNYIPTFKNLYEGLKNQPQTIIGIAHPLDTTSPLEEKSDKFLFLEDLYSKFKSECKEKAVFSEVYYQSYKPDLKELKEDDETKQFMTKISDKYNLLKTGSQDTHRKNIFCR